MGLLEQWNKNRFSIYKNDEKTVLKLIETLSNWLDTSIKKIDEVDNIANDNKNKKVSYDDLHNKYKLSPNADFTGSWFGLTKPTLSEEGARAQVEKNMADILKLQGEVKNIYTYDITREGAKGDGTTDNKAVFKDIFSKINDYESIYIPKGIYKVILQDNDLIDMQIGAKNMHTLLHLQNKTGVRIYGQGKLVFDASQCTKKPSIMWIENCNNITIEGLHFVGDAYYGLNVVIGEQFINGITMENSHGCRFINNIMENIMAVISSSGDRHSPSYNGNVAKDNIISNNIFRNYGQVSTFGGGTSRFIFSNNICVNALQCGIKISTNVQTEGAINNSYDILIEDNIFTWEEDYVFSLVAWDLPKTFSPVAIMSESHSNNIVIKGNICDFGRIKQNLSNAIQTIACIVVYRGNSNADLYNRLISIEDNLLIGYKNKNTCISVSPFTRDLIIKNNICCGSIGIGTNETLSTQCNLLNVIGNTLYNDDNVIGISLGNSWFKTVNIKGNTINGRYLNPTTNYYGFIELSKCKADILNIVENELNGVDIVSYSNGLIEIGKINITNNHLQGTVLYLHNDVVCLDIKGNVYNSPKTINTLRVPNANTVVNFNGNSGYTNGTIINIDNGRLRIEGNSIEAKTGAPYSIGTTFLVSGIMWGNGSPEGVVNAQFGAYYLNIGVTQNALYLKTTVNGNTGWKVL